MVVINNLSCLVTCAGAAAVASKGGAAGQPLIAAAAPRPPHTPAAAGSSPGKVRTTDLGTGKHLHDASRDSESLSARAALVLKHQECQCVCLQVCVLSTKNNSSQDMKTY
jgi:hypothetical protein